MENDTVFFDLGLDTSALFVAVTVAAAHEEAGASNGEIFSQPNVVGLEDRERADRLTKFGRICVSSVSSSINLERKLLDGVLSMLADILVEDADGSASCIDMSPLLLEAIASNIVSKESPYVLMMGQLVRETGDRYTTLGASKSSTGSVERNAEDDDAVKNGDGCSSSSLGAPA